ncbi:MAG: UDP-N-acetylmuramoyl-L-alanyl-D-glutamate--2,6-diaminopimelate ligase [Fimbriimonadales bacterium]|nr:UDP-N-acetylmuramoyl-L-alanyl-D-glutamate--2,6-diaminopimelate ligase [Fimbriimonadales bacterium]
MKLSELAGALEDGVCIGDAEVTSLVVHSGSAMRGSLFICLPGTRSDGHRFVEDALQRGAVGAVVSQQEVGEFVRSRGKAVLLVRDTVEACWRISKSFYGDPSRDLTVVGITGTNGKTTVAWLTWQALRDLHRRAGYMGTLGVYGEKERREMDLTTPFPPTLQETLRNFRDQGTEVVVMEVSSHALAQKRVDGVEFDYAVFTNLSQDHFDYHRDMESYFQAKKRLFGGLPQSKGLTSICNADDEYGRRILQEVSCKVEFGTTAKDLRILSAYGDAHSVRVEASWRGREVSLEAPLAGRFNVMNLSACFALVASMGVEPERLAEVLRGVRPAPGRFEVVSSPEDEITVIVDYAHTPDALEKLLLSVRDLNPPRVVTVFGCGGDRDATKRAPMGAVASRLSDRIYITSDNPRTEDPEKIIQQIIAGVEPHSSWVMEPDRRRAIFQAVAEARAGDFVVIAGKGHETYQILGTQKVPFDDREVARQALQKKRKCN